MYCETVSYHAMPLQAASQLENWVWYFYRSLPFFRRRGIVTHSKRTEKACLLPQSWSGSHGPRRNSASDLQSAPRCALEEEQLRSFMFGVNSWLKLTMGTCSLRQPQGSVALWGVQEVIR